MRRRTVVLGSVVLVGAALVLFCCTGGGRDAKAPTPGAGSARPGAAPPPSELALPDASGSTRALAPRPDGSGALDTGVPSPSGAAAPSAAPPRPAGAGAGVADAVRTSDPRDLKLLSAIERELQRDPPPEVHALLAQRKKGAGRDELARAIRSLGDLRLRVLAFRWLDDVAPALDAGKP